MFGFIVVWDMFKYYHRDNQTSKTFHFRKHINFVEEKLLVWFIILFWMERQMACGYFRKNHICCNDFPFPFSWKRKWANPKKLLCFAGSCWVSRWLHRSEWWYGSCREGYYLRFPIWGSGNVLRFERYLGAHVFWLTNKYRCLYCIKTNTHILMITLRIHAEP